MTFGKLITGQKFKLVNNFPFGRNIAIFEKLDTKHAKHLEDQKQYRMEPRTEIELV